MLYRLIPFFNTVREPGRFDMVVTIALAIMAAYGVKSLTEHKEHEAHHAPSPINMKFVGIVAVIAILFLIESNGIPLSGLAASAVTTNLSIPLAYSQIGQLQGNYSILQLPIVPNSYSAYPELYAGEAMYYQTASHKAIVGGYATRENNTQQLSTYQIPLAVQGTSLLDYGQLLYQSPISENYTNQTLLTLYNYNTAFVAINKAAYNQTQFLQLASQVYATFGPQLYNDNSTIIFSTQNAIGRSLYRSYVAYPILSDWNQSVVFVNGSYQQQWSPVGAGAVSVFAPYANRSANQTEIYNTLYHNQVYYINSTITVYAASDAPQRLYVGVPTSATNYSALGYANLTSQFTKYTFNVIMASVRSATPTSSSARAKTIR